MSTETTTKRNRRHEAAPAEVEAEAKTEAEAGVAAEAEAEYESASAAAAADEADNTTNSNVVVVEIAGQRVSLNRKFFGRHVLTNAQSLVLDAACRRQFVNNQTANAKTRAEAYAAATTDAERAAKAPLTAQQIAALYVTYEPSVGSAPRMSNVEKARRTAAWRAWVLTVEQHNAAIDAGEAPVIVRAGRNKVTVQTPPRKDRGVSVEAHAQVLAQFEEAKDMFLDALLAAPEYSARIKEQLDLILAERGNKPAEVSKEPVVVGGLNLLG